MLELKRIYWTRQVLRLAFSAVIVWLGASVVLALMPKTNEAAGPGPVGRRGFSRHVRRRPGRGALPAVRRRPEQLSAASSVPGTSDAGTRSGASPASSAAKEWPGPGASVRWKPGSAALFPARRARRPFLPVVQGRVHQPAEFRRCLREVQPGKERQDSLAGQQERLERRRRDYVTHDVASASVERQPLP